MKLIEDKKKKIVSNKLIVHDIRRLLDINLKS
jgi:hypothetical protein